MAVTEHPDNTTRPKPPASARFAQFAAAGGSVGLPMVSFIFILGLSMLLGHDLDGCFYVCSVQVILPGLVSSGSSTSSALLIALISKSSYSPS